MTRGPDTTATIFSVPGPAAEGLAAAAGVAAGGKAPLAAFAVSAFLHGAVAAGVIFGFGGLGETPPTTQNPIIVELVFMSPSPGKAVSNANSAANKSAAERNVAGPVEPVEAVQAAASPSSRASRTAKRPSQANKPRRKAAANPQPAKVAELSPAVENERRTETTQSGALGDTPDDTQPSIQAPAVNVVSATVLKAAADDDEGLSGNKNGGFIGPAFQLGSANNPIPRYPRRARQQGIEGRVVIRLTVTADGTPARISVLQSSGHAILDRAVIRTFRDWRFRPATRAGVPVASSLDVPISFRLHD